MTEYFNKKSLKPIRKVLRKNMPPAEIILWKKLKGKQLKGYKFRRQYSVGNYVIDFHCPKLKLAIEVDGDSHCGEWQEQYDKKRQEFIECFDIKFLRFTNSDVYNNLDGVLEEILRHLP